MQNEGDGVYRPNPQYYNGSPVKGFQDLSVLLGLDDPINFNESRHMSAFYRFTSRCLRCFAGDADSLGFTCLWPLFPCFVIYRRAALSSTDPSPADPA